MKICIELDEEMKEKWENVKDILEAGFKYVYRVKVDLSELEVFGGLLFCFEDEIESYHFPKSFEAKN